MTEIFSALIDPYQKKVTEYISKSHSIMMKNLKLDDLKINLFSENACVINVSLNNPIGRVRRITSNV